MSDDLLLIEEHFGTDMSKLCNELFPNILEEYNLLPKILLSSFHSNPFLYDDLVYNEKINEFKKFILSLYEDELETNKTPKQLLEEVGYDLYECKSEEDIQKFKKYYQKDEELSTFIGNRLSRCHIFFCVKKEVDYIKRSNYKEPLDNDTYATSVICIQFSKTKDQLLSIKNRYNSKVQNPDKTYQNNLDLIANNLSKSFAKFYKLNSKQEEKYFELEGYVRTATNKYYKYNYKVNDIYYCPNNIIIERGKPKKLDEEKYIVFDYFILDKQTKKIINYDPKLKDGFLNTLDNIKEITHKDNIITITTNDNKQQIITLNSENKIIKIYDEQTKTIENNYLKYNETLEEINMSNTKIIKNNFLLRNKKLKKIILEEVIIIGDNALYFNEDLKEVILEKVKIIGDCFLFCNKKLTKLESSNLESIGNNFLVRHTTPVELYLPNIIEGKNSLNLDHTIIIPMKKGAKQ